MPAVLFVCTANLCRSPMAEGLFRRLISSRPDVDQWKIDSAGLWAQPGISPSSPSQIIMKKMGIDISSHRSQPADEDLLKQYDLVLTMEKYHRDELRDRYPACSNRIFMLSEMIDGLDDVRDPIGGGLNDYEETARGLEQILTEGADRIILMAIQNNRRRVPPG